MKRSKLIKQLEDEALLSYEEALQVLAIVEREGMKPPELKVSFNLKKADGTNQRTVSLVNKWELE